jgi:hypothetical protein
MSRKLVPQNRKLLSAHQVLLQLEEEKYFDRADIFITPPVNANFSDEDSDDEDVGCDIDHLSKRQLEAEAECTLHSGFEQIRFSSSSAAGTSTIEDGLPELEAGPSTSGGTIIRKICFNKFLILGSKLSLITMFFPMLLK